MIRKRGDGMSEPKWYYKLLSIVERWGQEEGIRQDEREELEALLFDLTLSRENLCGDDVLEMAAKLDRTTSPISYLIFAVRELLEGEASEEIELNFSFSDSVAKLFLWTFRDKLIQVKPQGYVIRCVHEAKLCYPRFRKSEREYRYVYRTVWLTRYHTGGKTVGFMGMCRECGKVYYRLPDEGLGRIPYPPNSAVADSDVPPLYCAGKDVLELTPSTGLALRQALGMATDD